MTRKYLPLISETHLPSPVAPRQLQAAFSCLFANDLRVRPVGSERISILVERILLNRIVFHNESLDLADTACRQADDRMVSGNLASISVSNAVEYSRQSTDIPAP